MAAQEENLEYGSPSKKLRLNPPNAIEIDDNRSDGLEFRFEGTESKFNASDSHNINSRPVPFQETSRQFATESAVEDRDTTSVGSSTAEWSTQGESGTHLGVHLAEADRKQEASSFNGYQGEGRSSGEDENEELESDLDLGLGDISPTPVSGMMGWLHQQMVSGISPCNILARILPSEAALPMDLSEFEMWTIIADYLRMMEEPPKRRKLETVNTFDDVLSLIRTRKRIMIVTGAGVSVSCGIPDFRSRDGVYARLAVDFPDLPDPQSMFDIHYFRRDPRPFFKFAKEIYPGQFQPSISHKFIALLQQHGKLLRNYTQNIDTLEQVAGITRVVQCHGSFANATCTRCGLKVDSDAIRREIFAQVVPVCPNCPTDTAEQAILKPDIVFFGEGLPNKFYDCLDNDKHSVDLLIVIGSSLKVRPVATIPYPNVVSNDIPQVLINREPLPHMKFDVELLGDCDGIISEICRRLGVGWDHICKEPIVPLQETKEWPKAQHSSCQNCLSQSKTLSWVSPSSREIVSAGVEGSREFELAPTPPASGSSQDVRSENVLNEVSKQNNQSEISSESKSEAKSDLSEATSSSGSERTGENRGQDLKHENPSESPNQETSTTGTENMKGTATCGPVTLSKETNNVEQQNKGVVESSAASSSVRDEEHVPHDNCMDSGRFVSKKDGLENVSKSRRRGSIPEYLEPSTYLFVPPSRYIFHGAEVFMPSDSQSDIEDLDEESPCMNKNQMDGLASNCHEITNQEDFERRSEEEQTNSIHVPLNPLTDESDSQYQELGVTKSASAAISDNDVSDHKGS